MKIGAVKPGDPSVTAVSVCEIVPSQLANIMAHFSTIVNDDNIGSEPLKASEQPNGLMLRQYTDVEGDSRQAFHYNAEQKQMPDQLSG